MQKKQKGFNKYFLTKIFVPMALLGAVVFSVTGCNDDKYDKLYPSAAVNCDTSGITYAADIAPIIASNCFNPGNGCHDAIGARTSGYDYTTYDGVIANVKDGALLTDINWAPTSGHNDMPKNAGKLAQCDINKITSWINEGYPNN